MIPLDPRTRRLLWWTICGFTVLCILGLWYVLTEVILK